MIGHPDPNPVPPPVASEPTAPSPSLPGPDPSPDPQPALPPQPEPELDDASGRTAEGAPESGAPVEVGGRDGLDPTRYGDWEKNGRCIDF